MVFSLLIAIVVFASSAFCAPAIESRDTHYKRLSTHSGRNTIESSKVWTGVASTVPKGQVTSVWGTFALPYPSFPGGSKAALVSAWVGIDGVNCTNALWQVGVDIEVQPDKSVSYQAWYEWYPAGAAKVTLDMQAGDQIDVYVHASSTTTGSFTMTNLRTKQSVTKTATAGKRGELCLENASWIVEAFTSDDQIPLPNFGRIEFTGAGASTHSKGNLGPGSGIEYLILDSNFHKITDVTLSSNAVLVSYVA